MQTPSHSLAIKLLCIASLAVSLNTAQAAETNEPTSPGVRLSPLKDELSKIATTLGKQFANIAVLAQMPWNALLHAIPQDSPCMSALVSVRLLMSNTKTFNAQEILEQALAARLKTCGLPDGFVVDQSDFIGRLWTAYQTPDKPNTWALPFVTEQLKTVSSISTLPPECKKVIDDAVTCIDLAVTAAPAVAALIEAGKTVHQLIGNGKIKPCC